MTYKPAFKESALKEWKKLNPTLQEQFKKILKERLKTPHVPGSKLSGMKGCYKIKLRAAGYRLVYEVQDEVLVVTVVAVGKREGGEVYSKARDRL